jgi:hypothetical protein
VTARRLEAHLASGDVLTAIDAFIEDWTTILLESDYAAGCPVVAGALDPTTRRAAGTGFHRWEQLLREALERSGSAPDRAESLAVAIIAAIEGALVLSRAEGSTRPLERVAEQLRAMLAS